MDPPPSLYPHTTPNHPDSANSSPRSRPDAWDDTSLAQIPGAKLRLMCSYGGHIIPRPHDKSLCYVGGETRIVVVDRQSSLAELYSRLSHTLLNGRHFTLKYQLPTEDLDSLISLAADEDLDNMIDEYDRSTSASPLKPSRLRLFLFPTMPETAASMGCLLDDAKSETWFVDALNGSGLLPRGLSDPAGIDTLLELDRIESCTDLEAHNESSLGNNNKQVVDKTNPQEAVVLDLPPAVETTSSFGSSTSSPSMAHLPAIKVRVEDYQMVGLDEQFSSQMNIASPPMPCFSTVAAAKPGGGMNYAAAVNGENPGRVICDDEKSEKSDHGTVAPSALRKPPLPLQPVQRKFVDVQNLPSPDSKHSGGYNLPSPDSVTSDCSMASAGSLSKHTVYQEAPQPVIYRENRTPPPLTEPKLPTNNINQDQTSQVPPPQQQQNQNQNQQQFIHPATHYIQHPPPMSMSTSYYPIYTHQQQNPHDPQQHYPIYILPQTQHPGYDAASTRPPVYPPKPEMQPNMYPPPGPGPGQMMVQVPAHQFQHQQYSMGMSQMPATPQPTGGGAGGGGGYGYEYSHHMQDQVYYTQQPPPPPPQYQTMTAATAVMLSQASAQLPADANGQQ